MSERLSSEDLEFDKPREACGVFGIYAPGEDVATMTYLGLHNLQHRGQDAAGIATVQQDGFIMIESNLGEVEKVFNRGVAHLDYKPNRGISIGHTRYSTIKTDDEEKKLRAVHPLLPEDGTFAAAYNGHITNYEDLAIKHDVANYITDSECFTKALGRLRQERPDKDLVSALAELLPQADGAISMVLTDGERLVAARDRNGFRPLVIGELPDGGYVVASEPPALETVGAQFLRSVQPGEIVVVDKDGLKSHQVEQPNIKFCSLEYAYFSRPDSTIEGRNVHLVRQALGQRLAQEHPLSCEEVDMVIGVPESGVSAALGYAKQTGIPLEYGLTKSRYVARTFIKDNQVSRQQSARLKYHPNRDVIEGHRLAVVDDSIIRGTTTKELVSMLREKGATEVHLRIPSPPNRWPCFMGMDTGNPAELIANVYDEIDGIRQYVGADSLAYVSLEGFLESIEGMKSHPTRASALGRSLCKACMDGNYPIPVPIDRQRLPVLIK